MSSIHLAVSGLGKRFSIQSSAPPNYQRLSETIVTRSKNALGRLFGQNSVSVDSPHPVDFWAIKDLSFEIPSGEVVGIIGRNGAGKSTLLKLLSRITAPTTGRITLNGRVASLLEVGTGFHPELTGRENIFLNGAILGMSKAEIQAKFDEIVAFAEVEKFLDTPVKRYSSGMIVRLAFAVAAHLEPEILIVDEVLAVGDTEFQRKCLGRMGQVSRAGRTVLFVSHNLAAVRSLCTRALLLQNGRLIEDGPVADVLTAYSAALGGTTSSDWERSTPPSQTIAFERVSTRINAQGSLACAIRLHVIRQTPPCMLALDICDATGQPLMQAMPSQEPVISGSPGFYQIDTIVHLPALIPGHYLVDAWVGPHFSQTLDYIRQAVSFDITVAPQANRTHPYTPDHGFIAPPCDGQVLFSISAFPN